MRDEEIHWIWWILQPTARVIIKLKFKGYSPEILTENERVYYVEV